MSRRHRELREARRKYEATLMRRDAGEENK